MRAENKWIHEDFGGRTEWAHAKDGHFMDGGNVNYEEFDSTEAWTKEWENFVDIQKMKLQ